MFLSNSHRTKITIIFDFYRDLTRRYVPAKDHCRYATAIANFLFTFRAPDGVEPAQNLTLIFFISISFNNNVIFLQAIINFTKIIYFEYKQCTNNGINSIEIAWLLQRNQSWQQCKYTN